VLVYSFGLYAITLIRDKGLVSNIADSVMVLMLREYVVLLCIFVIRIFNMSFLKFSKIYVYSPKENCSDFEESNKIKKTIMLSFDHYILHLLSAALVIYMYRPTKSGKEESMNDEYSQIAEDGKLW
jgi:hypothetical protein